MEAFLEDLGDEIQSVDEETFDLFSRTQSSQDLGMVDPKAKELEIYINGRDLTIKQSPGVLLSNRGGGTTGAALWRSCVHFAEWLGWSQNTLFGKKVLTSRSVVLELGSGISGLVPVVLSPRVDRIVATDQQYAVKLLEENITTNLPNTRAKLNGRREYRAAPKKSNIDILTLDWESDDVGSLLHLNGLDEGVDALLACDCVFNYALIEPFMQCCIDICKRRSALGRRQESASSPTLCIIAQQLRQPDVFQQWLEAFMAAFHVWRIPSEMLTEALNERSGFVLHVGILRQPQP